jgi:hypothetical protein
MSYPSSTTSNVLLNFINGGDENSITQVAIVNSTNQTLTGSAPNAIVFGTTPIAPTGSSLSVGTNSINVLNSGIYNISFNVQVTPSVVGSHLVSILNGATVLDTIANTIPTINVPYTFAINKLYNLAAGSVISMTATQPSGAAVINGASGQRASLCIASQQ